MSNLIDQYRLWPELLIEGYSRGVEAKIGGLEGRRIVVCGMGGSGFSGDLANLVSRIYESRVSIEVVKDFAPESFRVYEGLGLVFAVSYSGDTIETISCALKALEEKINVIVISSGGLLRRLAEKKGLLWIPLRPGLKPRAALPAMAGAILGVLSSLSLIKLTWRDVESAGEKLRKLDEREAIPYAEAIASSTLVTVASTRDVYQLAERWRSEIAENSKKIAKVEVYPESAHNDINSWLQADTRVSFILVEGWSIYGREALEIASKILEKTGRLLKTRVEPTLGGLLENALLAGIASTIAGQLAGIDPADTPAIKYYRVELERLWRDRLAPLMDSDLSP